MAHSIRGDNMSENVIPDITFSLNAAESVPVPVDDTLSVEGEAADAAAVGEALAEVAQTAASNLSTAIDGVEDQIAALFPVGAVYISTSTTAPAFGGTWAEILIPTTWGDLATGARSYDDSGTGTPGTLHFWLRTE